MKQLSLLTKCLILLVFLAAFTSAHAVGGTNPFPRSCKSPAMAACVVFVSTFFAAFLSVLVPIQVTTFHVTGWVKAAVLLCISCGGLYFLIGFFMLFGMLDAAIRSPRAIHEDEKVPAHVTVRIKRQQIISHLMLVVMIGFIGCSLLLGGMEVAGLNIYDDDDKITYESCKEVGDDCVTFMNRRVNMIGQGCVMVVIEGIRYWTTRAFLIFLSAPPPKDSYLVMDDEHPELWYDETMRHIQNIGTGNHYDAPRRSSHSR